MKLYMFRAVPLPIIRSLFTVLSALVYVIQVCRQLYIYIYFIYIYIVFIITTYYSTPKLHSVRWLV